ncbi:MAG: glutamine synthetase type III [Clostridiaceae bacterium]|nr:glutamine synthetase type III [Clostridiaceae bacterium]
MSELAKIFGSQVFNDSIMREKLPTATYNALRNIIDNNLTLDPNLAEVVASAMKEWAIERGATHYCHWFQPMTGMTAEKHDSFISTSKDGKIIMEFSGKELIKGESDASSFPNGGIRATFEARGYTAWDFTSPAFVKDKTLYIPTAFCSYSGEALDKKTPLLRSMDALNRQGLRVLRALGNKTARKVISYVGAEQEYFLVDRELFMKRKDLIFTGRTLFGARPPKGQEMGDQYYASIKTRVLNFMQDLDVELWKLGIPGKTRHNEAAPAQHEIAPIYNIVNVAADQNQLMMETMRKVAARHGLACLLHEKPFAGVNGSGKHNNWSIGTDEGVNLLDPGPEPHKNTLFLLILAAIIRAVDVYADVIRSSVANAGNDYRLGAHEAPPAIVSIFLGDQLTDIIEQIEKEGEATKSICSTKLEMGASALPVFAKDITDRNRTSPFAFTGNKFEFRMVGSSTSISGPNFIINTAIADILSEVADRLEAAENKEEEAKKITREFIRNHKRIIFNGDNYSEEWIREAERRGLSNINNFVDAKKTLLQEKNIKMFSRMGVLSEKESHSRYEILMENYNKTIKIEALTAIEMVERDILPAVHRYITEIATCINQVRETGVHTILENQEKLLKDISRLVVSAYEKVAMLKEAVKEASAIDDVSSQGVAYRDKVIPVMHSLRDDIDSLETMVASKHWPIPTYGDMLFGLE